MVPEVPGLMLRSSGAHRALLSTNSITQGEQVAQLLAAPLCTRYELEIAFAHRTFAWDSDARGKAHVHVVIIGLDSQENVRADKRLFSYPYINGEPEETLHAALSPYLFDAVRTCRSASDSARGSPSAALIVPFGKHATSGSQPIGRRPLLHFLSRSRAERFY